MEGKGEAYLRWNKDALLRSIRELELRSFVLVLLDFLFYFLSYAVVFTVFKMMQAKYYALSFPDSMASLSSAQAGILFNQTTAFYHSLLIGIVLTFLLLAIFWSLFKGLIWAWACKAKLSLGFFLRFFFLNLCWLGFWLLTLGLLAMISNLSQVRYTLLGLFILFIMLTNTIYTLFVPTQTFRSVRDGIGLTFSRFHLLILPYLFLFTVYLIFAKLLDFIYGTIIHGTIVQIAGIAFTLIFIMVGRAYIINVVSRITNAAKKQHLNRKS